MTELMENFILPVKVSIADMCLMIVAGTIIPKFLAPLFL